MQLLFDLVYREKGEKKSRQLKIDFVSNYMRREISSFFQDAYKVKSIWDEMTDVSVKMSIERTTKETGYRERIKELEEKQKELTTDIEKLTTPGLASRNIELAIELLKDNGMKDETLLNPTFWDKSVEPAQINDFLIKAVDKDTNKKKVSF